MSRPTLTIPFPRMLPVPTINIDFAIGIPLFHMLTILTKGEPLAALHAGLLCQSRRTHQHPDAV